MILNEEIVHKIYNNSNLSDKEKSEFEAWILEEGNKEKFKEYIRLNNQIYAAFKSKSNVKSAWSRVKENCYKKKISFKLIVKYASVIMLPFAIAITIFLTNKIDKVDNLAQMDYTKPIKETNLVLSDGSSIKLKKEDDAKIKDSDVEVKIDPNINLTYAKNQDTIKPVFHKVYTSVGGDCNLTLSDGTIVFLNSKSYINYPTSFKGKKRTVYVEGEAYFKVAKDKNKPFEVQTKYGRIKVLGTEFNVKSYKEDECAKTTLVEGSIKYYGEYKQIILAPSDQVISSKKGLSVKKVDVFPEISWIEGLFYFKNKRLEDIMTDLARWYNIKVFYLNSNVTDFRFTAEFDKKSKFEKVVKILEQTNRIKIEINKNTILIRDTER